MAARAEHEESEDAVVPEKLHSLVAYLDSLEGKMDLVVVEKLLRNLDGLTCEDIKRFTIFKCERYQRNIIKNGEWYELIAMCWKSGQASPVHDHRLSSCGVRVVRGTATEVRYERDKEGVIRESNRCEATVNHICAAEDADIHALHNMQPEGDDLITLHIYSPPLQQFHTYKANEPGATLVDLKQYAETCAGKSWA